MTKFVLYSKKEHFIGYEVSGHSTNNQNDDEGRLVCSAVSSAVIMAANTITDVLNLNADVKVDDGYLKLTVLNPNEESDVIIKGLQLHICELAKEHKGKIQII
ncbi:MAG: ribosomal-processing cysteine protease Prp [Clostridia bacterium]|nr:ribosomal-processing cysteine protease Prp [Clostridia bacterium]